MEAYTIAKAVNLNILEFKKPEQPIKSLPISKSYYDAYKF